MAPFRTTVRHWEDQPTDRENPWHKEFAKCRTTAECDRLLIDLLEAEVEEMYWLCMQALAVKESMRIAHYRRKEAIEKGSSASIQHKSKDC